MNAYELADEFKNRNWDEVDCVLWCEKSANMLCQQADRIAELEDQLSFYEIKDLDSGLKTKPLSDEEVTDVFVTCLLPDGEFDEHEFARAIEERHGIK